MPEIRSNWRSSRLKSRNREAGAIRLGLALVIVVVGFFAFLRITSGHASASGSVIRSGISGHCLDDYKDSTAAGNMVSAWGCNGSEAQDWTATATEIKHGDSTCLDVKNNATSAGSQVIANSCTESSGQVWLRDKSGFYNPDSGLCLAAPNDASNTPLVLATCNNLGSASETWTPENQGASDNCSKEASEGAKIACYAAKEWTTWESGTISHETLLNIYTADTPNEEWCADFVSYVYREAGRPFTSAYLDWDENNADAIQNYGFTKHAASSGYQPSAGDIAYFDYSAGHVEIVASGGKNPTFIYGNSATIDPTTGNGQMKANTITSDGSEGHVIYYLSPNKS